MCEMKKGSTLVLLVLIFLLVTIHARPRMILILFFHFFQIFTILDFDGTSVQ